MPYDAYDDTDEREPGGGEAMAAMSDADLCALIEDELGNAIGYSDELSQDRQRNHEYYLGEPTGDLAPPEIENRSKAVSRDVLDTVEWMMPSLMRMFTGSDEVVRFEPDGREDEQAAADATAYVGYLIHRKNDGFTLLHDAIKSALIARMGVVKVYCDKRSDVREERYVGLSAMDVEALRADPAVEIISEQAIEADVAGQPALPGDAMGAPAAPPQPMALPSELLVSYTVALRRRAELMAFRAEGVPPEEIRIARDCRTIDDCRFIAHITERTLSDLKSLGYDPALVDALPTDETLDADGERTTRHDYDGSWPDRQPSEASQRKVQLTEAYLRVDTDGDGIAEYRRVVKAGETIFENDVVDDHPFALFSPILMPYKLIGLAVADLVTDLQVIKTALTRQVLDNVYLSNNPMTEAVEGQVNIDDLLSPRPGGVVRVREAGTIRPLTVPFVAGPGQALIEHFDAVREARTGVTDFNQGLNPESLAKSNLGSMGVEALMNAGAQRIELVARVFAETGIKRLYLLMLKLVTQYQNRVEQAKINGRWLQIDPRAWKNRYDLTVSVGIGTASRAQQVANLQRVLELQQQAAQYGLAGPQNAYYTLTRLVEAMGYKDSDQFWTPPPPPGQGQAQGQGGQADAAAQALVSAEQIKAQASLQKAQMDNQTRLQIADADRQSKERVAMFEAEQRILLEREKFQAELASRALAPAPPPRG